MPAEQDSSHASSGTPPTASQETPAITREQRATTQLPQLPPQREHVEERPTGRRRQFYVLLALIGTALLLGDGMITPAISVLGAVEGLKVAAPALQRLVIPITLALLVGLFSVQRFGTARVGGLFGPITLVWFIT